MSMLIKRNLKLYFRERAAVLFSLMSVFIAFGLYIFFLGDNMMSGLENTTDTKAMMNSWIMAGILAITGTTTTLGAFGILIDDNAGKISMDFRTAPLRRSVLAGGYVVSAMLIGFFMSLLVFAAAEIYIVTNGGALLSAAAMAKVLGVILLSVLSSSSLTFFLSILVKTRGAFSAVSTVVGTAIGFLTGVYIPVGSLGEPVQNIIKFFPVSYTGSLFRQIFMEQPMEKVFHNAPASAAQEVGEELGVTLQVGGAEVSVFASILILLATALVFYTLGILILNRKKR